MCHVAAFANKAQIPNAITIDFVCLRLFTVIVEEGFSLQLGNSAIRHKHIFSCHTFFCVRFGYSFFFICGFLFPRFDFNNAFTVVVFVLL